MKYNRVYRYLVLALSVLLICSCGRNPTGGHSQAPIVPVPAPMVPFPPISSNTDSDSAPRLGLITVGAFAPEVMPFSSLSIESLDSDQTYSEYRDAVYSAYGANLADMNYLGVGVSGWQSRFGAFDRWLHRASKFGDPTIAIEPIGAGQYDIFKDSAEMLALRNVFLDAQASGITVWVRFASESNLRYSVYSVYNNQQKIAEYRHAVRWFRSYMPSNVKIVFSPLINTVYLQNPNQLHTIVAMYEPGAYDRIGGTLYATTWLRPRTAFDWYYHFMRRLDQKTPFQICELGSIYPRSDEVRAFIIRVAQGQWPGVQRVNLFAGDLNPLAVNEHGHFGFILPGDGSSYLSDLFQQDSSVIETASSAQIAHMEELGAAWQSPNMTLDGTVSKLPDKTGDFMLLVNEVTDDTGLSNTLDPARNKRVVLTDGCSGTDLLSSMTVGETLEVTGWDSGTGSPLRATEITFEAAQ